MPMLPIRFLTIHCAATPAGRDVSADTVKAWDIAKFGLASYHHVVTLDGVAHRHLEDDERGAHVGGHNSGNIGVCYVGGMDPKNAKPMDSRTDAQRETLRQLVADYRAKYPGILVRGHRDWPNVAKACPSFDVATEL